MKYTINIDHDGVIYEVPVQKYYSLYSESVLQPYLYGVEVIQDVEVASISSTWNPIKAWQDLGQNRIKSKMICFVDLGHPIIGNRILMDCKPINKQDIPKNSKYPWHSHSGEISYRQVSKDSVEFSGRLELYRPIEGYNSSRWKFSCDDSEMINAILTKMK